MLTSANGSKTRNHTKTNRLKWWECLMFRHHLHPHWELYPPVCSLTIELAGNRGSWTWPTLKRAAFTCTNNVRIFNLISICHLNYASLLSLTLPERAAAQSVVPYAVRSYLRFKRGFMFESSGFKKFTRVWCVLADQHFLVFARKMDKFPKRIIYLHERSALITHVGGLRGIT